MAEAIALSLENVRRGGGPFGCVITQNDRIIARGANQVTQTNDPTAHAEIVAIRAACKALNDFQLHGCEIYSSCEPCPMCLAAIYWSRPERVFFGNTREDAAVAGFDDWLIYQEIALPREERGIPIQQLMGEEAKAAFEAWAKLENKIRY
jgi:tRNA(Arg) A34 adenosine deaminase TadA